jgi:PmbA protein
LTFETELELAGKAIKYAESKNVRDIEFFLLETQIFQVSFEREKICNIYKIVDVGYSIRVIIKEKLLGVSSGNDTDETELKRCVDAAVGASHSPHRPRKALKFPEPKTKLEPFCERYDKEVEAMVDSQPEQSVRLVKDVSSSILSYDNRIYAAMGDVSFVVEKKLIVNSEGVEEKERRTLCNGGILVFAKEGNKQSRTSNYFFHNSIKDVKTDVISEKCAFSSVSGLDARSILSTQCDLIFDPTCLQQILHFAFVPATFADNVFQGRSFLTNRVNEQVASAEISICDNGRHPQGLGSSETDDEGMPTQSTPIIQRGIFKGYLSDYFTAQRYGYKATGNGIRWIVPVSLRSYRYVPATGPTNIVLDKGKIALEDLISDTKKGLLIREVEDVHFSNFITGSLFMKIVRADMINNGEVLFPIKQRTLEGNIIDYLKNVDLVADDLTWTNGYKAHSSMCLPTIRVRKAK